MSSFESQLCALVAVWRGKGADYTSMVEAMEAEIAALRHHIAAQEADTAPETRLQDDV